MSSVNPLWARLEFTARLLKLGIEISLRSPSARKRTDECAGQLVNRRSRTTFRLRVFIRCRLKRNGSRLEPGAFDRREVTEDRLAK
jgi:hypothetical protein